MLNAKIKKLCKIHTVERIENALFIRSDLGILKLKPQSENIVRVTYTQLDKLEEFLGIGILKENDFSDWSFSDDENFVKLTTSKLTVEVNKATASIKYYDNSGKLLLSERDRDSRELGEFDSYKTVVDESTKIEEIDTPDGKKRSIKETNTIFDRKLYRTRLNLEFTDDEKIYGLGQFEEGALNLRGTTQYLHQANLKIPVPMLLSTNGYGMLFSTGSTAIFSDTKCGTYFYTDADIAMDFYFIAGDNFDKLVSGYRFLTGKASMLPLWAFGFMQSQERYETGAEMLEIAKGYRDRNIGIDTIILDWHSWAGDGWGQKTFDLERFPNPTKMIDDLHDMDVKFMLSIWPNMRYGTENHKEFTDKNLFLPASEVYDAFNEDARKLYWKQTEEGLFKHGIDSWWCDSSEPSTPEWGSQFKAQSAIMHSNYFNTMSKFMTAENVNGYPLVHAQAIYEGQRSCCECKRVTNLTRAAFTGAQRYGTIFWSGDTMASWDTMKKQITAGLNFCAAGIPYWTLDIGAFFVKKAENWFWNGDYTEGLDDLGYRELFTRWYQFGAFLPIFRSHGTDVRREMWLFDDEENHMFYDAMVEANKLRYSLLPYIYSLAGKIHLEDYTMMRLLAFDFANDEKACESTDSYMFGDSFLVCPVTEPMYYNANSTKIENPQRFKEVYLPKSCGWYDFYSGKFYEGGQTISVELTLNQMPLFVKAGSIIPMTNPLQSTAELKNAEITVHVYKGKDCSFNLYQDSGDGYDYEKGDYSMTKFTWDDKSSKLTVSDDKEYKVVIV